MHARTWIIFLRLLKVSCIPENVLLKKELTKISAKSSRFLCCNRFENRLNSDMSEQGSLDHWLETDYISKNCTCNLWHQPIIAKVAKYLILNFCCLLSPNLDVNDEFVKSRSSYYLKNGKTVREPSMMESLTLKLPALAMSITFLFL